MIPNPKDCVLKDTSGEAVATELANTMHRVMKDFAEVDITNGREEAMDGFKGIVEYHILKTFGQGLHLGAHVRGRNKLEYVATLAIGVLIGTLTIHLF